MKIGFDAKRVFHNFRGLGNYSRTLLEGLTSYYPNNDYVLFTPKFEEARAKEWHKRFENLTVVTPDNSLKKTFSSSWRSLFLANDIQKHGVEIYHGLSHEIPPGLRKRGIKSVVTIHDLIFMRFPEFFPWIDRQVYYKKFKFAVDNADLVIAICEQTKNDIIELLNCPAEKIRVSYQSCHPTFYSGVSSEDMERAKAKFGLKEHTILYVGAIEERKNAHLLVKAFARVKDLIPHQLILVGKGVGKGEEYKKKVQKEVISSGLIERVKFLDDVSHEELPALYQHADLFVYPSFYEGWGIPNVEALFSGTPVITSNVSSLPESAGPTSLLIDPHSVEELTEKMQEALFDDDLRERMIRQGLIFAENFHLSNTTKSLVDIYQELS